tara:strand:+ start:151 stop:912 length:762 start_codon:yes stop_codon:yes gene_type:complete
MIGLATGPGALFGYLNNAFSRANNATQRMFDNRDTLEDQRMRSIAGDLTFEPATITPYEVAIDNSKNVTDEGFDINATVPVGSNNNDTELGNAMADFAYSVAGRKEDNPYNNIPVATEDQAEPMTVTRYRAEGGDMPLNPTEYRERIAQNYSSTYGIPIGLARQRVDESGIFTKGRFMDSVERPQLELSNQIGEILRDQTFQQPDEIENFMINSGLLNLALRTGPYGQKLIPRYPQFTFDLGNEDYSNIIYGE